jgi:hypothetical protein
MNCQQETPLAACFTVLIMKNDRINQTCPHRIEHVPTGNVYSSYRRLAEQLQISSTTIKNWLDDDWYGLKRTEKPLQIKEPTLRIYKRKYGHKNILVWGTEKQADEIYDNLVPASKKPFRQNRVLIVQCDAWTGNFKGQKGTILSDKASGRHPCKVRLDDGSIVYFKKTQLQKI